MLKALIIFLGQDADDLIKEFSINCYSSLKHGMIVNIYFIIMAVFLPVSSLFFILSLSALLLLFLSSSFSFHFLLVYLFLASSLFFLSPFFLSSGLSSSCSSQCFLASQSSCCFVTREKASDDLCLCFVPICRTVEQRIIRETWSRSPWRFL